MNFYYFSGPHSTSEAFQTCCDGCPKSWLRRGRAPVHVSSNPCVGRSIPMARPELVS